MAQVLCSTGIRGDGGFFFESTRQGSSRWLTFPFLHSTKNISPGAWNVPWYCMIISSEKVLSVELRESVGGSLVSSHLLNFTKKSIFYDFMTPVGSSETFGKFPFWPRWWLFGGLSLS